MRDLYSAIVGHFWSGVLSRKYRLVRHRFTKLVKSEPNTSSRILGRSNILFTVSVRVAGNSSFGIESVAIFIDGENL